MSTTSSNLVATIESYLEMTAGRERAIASNMANVDTPGYRTVDIDFERAMQNATALHDAGFSDGQPRLEPALQEVSGLLERPDGNNVDIDRESLLLAQVQLQHQIGVQLIKHEFHGLLAVINGGS